MSPHFEIHDVRWTPETIRRFWTYFANTPHADRAYFSSLFGEQIAALAERYVSLVDRRILDYGCGPGFMIELLLRRGIRAEGLEFSPESAEKARKRCGNHPLFGGITLADGLPSPVESASIDVVFLVEVLEHLLPAQVIQTLEDIRRILRAGGFLILTTPHNEDLERIKTICPDCGCVFHPWQHVGSFTTATLPQLLQEHGVETVVCTATTLGGGWPGRARRFLRKTLLPATAVDEPHLLYIGRKRA